MKQYLLPSEGNFYKANLHCHTIISDGRETPERVKELYKEKGYSIVAFTDHEILVPHNDLTDDTFLALNGVEIQVKEDKPQNAKCCHMCFISPTQHVPPQPCFHREKYFIGEGKSNAHLVKIDENMQDYEREYTVDCINDVVKRFKEQGFFATYNHPTWSMENYMEYTAYRGFDAMEIMNGSCISMGYDDYNPRVYNDILAKGTRIYCIGADDNHNKYPEISRKSDCGCTFTMVKAKSLSYDDVFSAIKNGYFYASEGPEIYELYIDRKMLHISCSGADRINCNYGIRKAETAVSEKRGQEIYTASFSVPDDCVYFRVSLTDTYGRRAYTNAYFIDDILR